jgi:hypothetical protein
MSSGLPLKADLAQCSRHFGFVPIPDLGQPAVKFTTVAEALKRLLNLGV